MAGQDEDSVHTKRSKTLIVRHLPADLSREEKEDLLEYFGASSVRVLSDKGPLRHTAFATFSSETSASRALRRLHQLRILGHTLVVEFARDQENVVVLKSPKVSDRVADDPDEKQKKETQQPSVPLIDTGIAPSLGWEELDGDAAVCTCCDSQCRPPGCNSSSCVEHAVVTSKPWTLIQNKGFSETHDQWLNTVSGFILVQQPHHAEGVESESCEQGVESQEEELHEVEEEVLIGFAETENDEGMRDEEMDGGDAVMRVEDQEDVDEAQKEKEVMEKRD